LRTNYRCRHILKPVKSIASNTAYSTTVKLPAVLLERLRLLNPTETLSVSDIVEYILRDFVVRGTA